MFGRRGRTPLLVAGFALLLAVPSRAFAKNQTFYSGTPFGIGILGGLESPPSSGFVTGTSSSKYTTYFAAEPFLDLGNVVFRLHFGWHFYPLVSGGGIDPTGTYTENSNAGSFEYGGRVEFAPFISEDQRSRFYFVVGVNDSKVKIKNERTFSTGAYNGQTLSDQVQGSGTDLNGGIGFETFLAQNWSIAFEFGYRSMRADSLSYGSGTNLDGQTVTSSSPVQDAWQNNQGFHSYSPYGQVGLNLNL